MDPQLSPITPMIGSLLRLPHEAVVASLQEALKDRGVLLTPTELGVFLFPGPQGLRPIDLAHRRGMTRQAMNYVLSGLERRGFIERAGGRSPGATRIRLTGKGWEVVAILRARLAEVEAGWRGHLGATRFDVLKETLRELAIWLGKLPGTTPQGPSGRPGPG